MTPVDFDADLEVTLERIKAQGKGNLSDYHKALLQWTRNVDKRYAWVILLTLWFITFATLGPYRIYGLIFAKVTTEGIYTREEASWPVAMIITLENLMGPVISVIVYYISFRHSFLIGGILLVLGNGLCYFSDSIVLDVLLLGVVQGIGYAFILIPLMEVVNNYFLKYRNMALGVSLCGGTLSVFIMSPLFKWLLETYPWRHSYLALGAVCCIIPMMVPLLRPNPKPEPPESQLQSKMADRESNTLARLSSRALTYQNSMRRQSIILIARQGVGGQGACVSRQASVISVNPFASSVGLERKISRHIMEGQVISTESNSSQIKKKPSVASLTPSAIHQAYETLSLSEIGQDSEPNFDMAVIWSVLKTPAFHLIWFSELIYFWVFSIVCLVLVDYGIDRGLSVDESETLLQFQSIGEIVGRVVLTAMVDLGLLSYRSTVILTFIILGSLLGLITQAAGFATMAAITTAITASVSLVFVLLNGLLVDYLGEARVTLGYGMASFIGGALMCFRPQAVGYFRDELGSYDPLFYCLASSCAVSAFLWILEPLMVKLFCRKPDYPTSTENNGKHVNLDSSA